MLVSNNLNLLDPSNILEKKIVEATSDDLIFSKLPHDILRYIAHSFLSFKDILTMRKTCKGLNNIFDVDVLVNKCLQQKNFFTLYQFVFEKKSWLINSFANSFFEHANVKQQEKFFAALSVEEVRLVLAHAPANLSRLGLSFDRKHANNSFLLSRKPLLCTTELNDRNEIAHFIRSKFKSLKELSLSADCLQNPNLNLLQSFSCCFENLTKLSLNFFISTTDIIEKDELKFTKHTNLQALKISCHGVKNETIYHVFKTMGQIKCLYLNNWVNTKILRIPHPRTQRIIRQQYSEKENLGELKLKKLFVKLRGKTFKELAFNVSKFLNNHDWLFKSMPDLNYLEISNIDHLTDKSISIIKTVGNKISPLHVKLIGRNKKEIAVLNLNEKETIKKRRIE